jgi:flagellar export protein FliJ
LKRQEAKGMSGEKLRIYRAYLDGLDDREARQEKRLEEVTRLVEERRHAAESERIGKEALEHLQEKQKKMHIQMVERAEQKAIDEVLTLRFQLG